MAGLDPAIHGALGANRTIVGKADLDPRVKPGDDERTARHFFNKSCAIDTTAATPVLMVGSGSGAQ